MDVLQTKPEPSFLMAIPRQIQNAYEAVLKAHNAAVEAFRFSCLAQDIDDIARSILCRRGYVDQFLHRTGHEVEVSVHEPPYITEENDRELNPGMGLVSSWNLFRRRLQDPNRGYGGSH